MPESPLDLGFLSVCRELLLSLQERCHGIAWASVTSRDGLELASVGDGNQKLSVMAGTLQALADGIASEASLGDSREMIVSGPGGYFVTAGVRAGSQGVVVAALTGKNVTLGMVLSSMRVMNVELVKFMDANR